MASPIRFANRLFAALVIAALFTWPKPADAAESAAPAKAADAPTSATRPLLVICCGNSIEAVKQFEAWLGRPVDGITGYTGDAGWTDYDGSVGWAIKFWGEIDRPVYWSVPLIPKGASLAEAAAGKYDDHYRKAAEQLAKWRPQDGKLHIRTGWEFNGDWMPWAAVGKADAFVGAFRRFVTVYRSISPRFVFEWNVNLPTEMNPEDAYPGDEYVDIIGMDFYWNTQWDPADPARAWDRKLNDRYGLKWHQAFAKTHGKPTSYSEWGMRSNEGGDYIRKAHAWFTETQPVFQAYWNSNEAFRGKLSEGQYPEAGKAFQEVFGNRP